MTNTELWVTAAAHIICWVTSVWLLIYSGRVEVVQNPAREKALVTLGMYGMIFAGVIGLLYVANSQEVTRFALICMAVSTGLAFYTAGIVASVIDDRG